LDFVRICTSQSFLFAQSDMNTLKYLLLPCLAAAAVATKQYKGAFEVVGTLCYPPDVKGEDKVTITTNSDANKFQRVVMYDGESIFSFFPTIR
jgi:hypothetical protein